MRLTGTCFKCHRRPKRQHACALCDLVIKVCNYHIERGFGEIQQHVISEHPAEYRAARAASEAPRAIAPQAFTPVAPTVKLAPAVQVGHRNPSPHRSSGSR
jgi:hypothetical protein